MLHAFCLLVSQITINFLGYPDPTFCKLNIILICHKFFITVLIVNSLKHNAVRCATDQVLPSSTILYVDTTLSQILCSSAPVFETAMASFTVHHPCFLFIVVLPAVHPWLSLELSNQLTSNSQKLFLCWAFQSRAVWFFPCKLKQAVICAVVGVFFSLVNN